MKPKNYVKKAHLNSGFMVKSITEKQKVVDLITSLQPRAIQKDMMLLGPDTDGGYMLPDDLKDIKACFSPEVE